MAGRIISLTPARKLPPDGRILIATRADITDYGTPGAHLHGPLAERGRSKASQLGIPGAGNGPGEADLPQSAFQACIGAGGNTVNGHVTVVTGLTGDSSQVDISERITGPAVITHVGYGSNTAFSSSQSFGLKVSDDNATTDGMSTTGTPIAAPPGVGLRIFPTTRWQDFYPYFLVNLNQFYVKIITENNTGGTVVIEVFIDLRYLWN